MQLYSIRQLTENIPNWAYYPKLWIKKYTVWDNIPNWELGISESGKAESENKSPIPSCIEYPQLWI